MVPRGPIELVLWLIVVPFTAALAGGLGAFAGIVAAKILRNPIGGVRLDAGLGILLPIIRQVLRSLRATRPTETLRE